MGALDLQHAVGTPTVSAKSTNTTTTSTLEQFTRVNHRSTTLDVGAYKPAISSKKVKAKAAEAAAAALTNKARRHDMATLKRL